MIRHETTAWQGPREIAVLDHGYVALVDTMGDDRTPAQCARTSFRNAAAQRTEEQDQRLTRYLVSHGHNTPLEFCQLRFYMKLPLFVAAQLVRHRTASINQVSYRYVKAAREFYIPATYRMQRQSTDNKQGSSDELVADPDTCRNDMTHACHYAFTVYERMTETWGMSHELARIVLPQATYTEWYYQMDLHNLIHLLRLRLDPHAQWETRQYAEAMRTLASSIYPTALAAAGL